MTVLSYLDSQAEILLTKEQTELFTRCFFAERANNALFTQAEADECGDIGKIFYHRLAIDVPVKMTYGLALFVMSLTGGVPARIVMWAYTMNRIFKNKAGRHLTLDDLVFSFPLGFPNEVEEQRLWDAQKGRCHGRKCDNMVDQIDTWELKLTTHEPGPIV